MSADNIGGDRILKVCDLCGGVDDHPRHIGAQGGPGDAVAPAPTEAMVNKVLDAAPPADRARLLLSLQDLSSTEHHYDCGAQAGCRVCQVIAAGATGVGADMLEHVVAAQADFDDPGIVRAEAE